MLRQLIVLLVLLAFTLSSFVRESLAQELRVSAAISLREAMSEIGEDYAKRTDTKISLNFGASGQLMQQVRAGAPVDVFVSASLKQIDELKSERLLTDAPPRVIARNTLVLIVPSDAAHPPTTLQELTQQSVKRITLGQPRTVPAGVYATQALIASNVIEQVRPKLVMASDVRQALDYVARGEVDAGLVYSTDALAAGDRVRMVQRIDPALHEPIIYTAVTIRTGRADQATRFIDFLLSDAGQRIHIKHGFAPAALPAAAAPASTATMPGSAVTP
jgi:molybdate transport system substrate-binding protein